jgi:chemotaxis protein MotA
MDIATIIGLAGGTILVVLAIVLGGNALVFMNIPGLLIVVGGTFAAAFIKFSLADVINSVNVAMQAFKSKEEGLETIIARMVELAGVARRDGLIALEQQRFDDEFVDKAIQYLVDGYDEYAIKETLEQNIQLTVFRHSVGQNVFKGMGDSAPAFGMIGTLIGLVQMLSSLSDPSAIGPAMAVALLTTLYGALIANLICMPLADKLALRSQQEQIRKSLILVAVQGISKGLNPRVLEESLKAFLDPKKRKASSAA